MHLLAVKLKATRKPHKSTKPSTNQPNDKQMTSKPPTNQPQIASFSPGNIFCEAQHFPRSFRTRRDMGGYF